MHRHRSLHRRGLLKLGAGAAAGFALASPAIVRAQAGWPDKPVRIIVPFAAGGGTDALARPWAEKLSQAFRQQFVIDNRGGASGLIGTEAAAKSAADGYTFLFAGPTTTVAIPLMRKVNYEPENLIPVARMGDVVCGFVITAATGPRTLPEVIAHAKKNPGVLAFGSSGNGTTPHLRFEAFKYRTGLDIMHIPYRGGADSLNDLLSNNIHLMNEPVTLPHVRAGKLHMFVVNDSKRMPEFPDVPTLTEAGYPNSDVPIWFTLWAPGSTPKEIIQKLNAKVTELAATDDMKARINAAGCAPVIQTLDEIAAYREKDRQTLAELIKAANIKLE